MSYSIGHIYKIICSLDNNFCYIGSTFNELRHRFQGHKTKFNSWLKDKKIKKCSIFPYFEKYGIENFKIILIKSYNVVRTHQRDNKHLSAFETLWINKTKNCVNECLPFNPLLKFKCLQQRKQYYQENKVEILECRKKYKEENPDKIKERSKNYYKKNKEKLNQKSREYQEKNKELISVKTDKKYSCLCGSVIRTGEKARHFKSKKHIAYCQKI